MIRRRHLDYYEYRGRGDRSSDCARRDNQTILTSIQLNAQFLQVAIDAHENKSAVPVSLRQVFTPWFLVLHRYCRHRKLQTLLYVGPWVDRVTAIVVIIQYLHPYEAQICKSDEHSIDDQQKIRNLWIWSSKQLFAYFWKTTALVHVSRRHRRSQC